MTRFPPEPNGYLHIGHAKSICVNFGLANELGGDTFMRFDDTNPEKEEREYIDAIQEDVKWLGFDWGTRLTHASDYFEKFHEYAIMLIKSGDAYVDSLTPEQAARSHRAQVARLRPATHPPSQRAQVPFFIFYFLIFIFIRCASTAAR